MARKESNIYKRKDGRWEARYVKEIGLDGRKKYGSVYGGTYTEAQQKRLEIMRNVRPYVVSSNSSVLSDIMWEWIQSVRNSIKPNTLQKYDSIIRKHIETTVIGKTNLRFLNAKSISDFANQKAESGLSVKTVNDILIVVGLALNYAEEVYQIPKIKVSFLKERAKEIRVLDISEQKKLEAFLIGEMNLWLYTQAFVSANCALWTGAILPMKSKSARPSIESSKAIEQSWR